MANPSKLCALAFVVALVAAACGSHDTTTTAETTTTVSPSVDRRPADAGAPTDEWVAGVNAAGWGFHRSREGSAVSSPVSIGTALSLARAGASRDTGAVLDRIFGFPAAGSDASANAVDLRLAASSVEPTTLEVANRLFPDDEFSPLPQFLETAAGDYGATIRPIDTADGAAAADTINGWVSDRTRGLIPVLVDEGFVQDQQLILVNTVHLKADWAQPFLAELTADDEFTTADGRRSRRRHARPRADLPPVRAARGRRRGRAPLRGRRARHVADRPPRD